jgi:hypothetical protein
VADVFFFIKVEQHGLGDTICRWIGSMLGSRKIIATLAGETLEGSVAGGCLQGAFYHLCCGAWLWTDSQEDSMGMANIHWDMQTTLLTLSTENSQTLSQSFYRRL